MSLSTSSLQPACRMIATAAWREFQAYRLPAAGEAHRSPEVWIPEDPLDAANHHPLTRARWVAAPFVASYCPEPSAADFGKQSYPPKYAILRVYELPHTVEEYERLFGSEKAKVSAHISFLEQG
ncbi:hypothetical protein Landi51_00506 [Colletotrichum acutatum]